MADTQEYLARLKALTSGQDPIELQRNTIRVLPELIDGVPGETLSARPAPDKWSVNEILAHLAEDEITTAWRYRQMIEYDGGALAGFDQELWARLGDYASRKAEDSLQMFRLIREANLAMMERLTSEEWERSGVHAERGRTTVRGLALHIAAHDLNHIEQIRRILGKQSAAA